MSATGEGPQPAQSDSPQPATGIITGIIRSPISRSKTAIASKTKTPTTFTKED
ncbi:hypothetical protein ACFLWY_01075 [Chloroflexota bacterium]